MWSGGGTFCQAPLDLSVSFIPRAWHLQLGLHCHPPGHCREFSGIPVNSTRSWKEFCSRAVWSECSRDLRVLNGSWVPNCRGKQAEMNVCVYAMGAKLNCKAENVSVRKSALLQGCLGFLLLICANIWRKKKKILWKLPVFLWFSLQRSVEFCSWVAKSKGKIRKAFY